MTGNRPQHGRSVIGAARTGSETAMSDRERSMGWEPVSDDDFGGGDAADMAAWAFAPDPDGVGLAEINAYGHDDRLLKTVAVLHAGNGRLVAVDIDWEQRTVTAATKSIGDGNE